MAVLELLGVVALAVAAFGLARWAQPRWSLPLFAVVGSVVGLDVLAVATDYRGAAGIIDCWPYCSGVQDFVRTTLPLGAIVLVSGMVGGAVRSDRGAPHR